MLRSDARCRSFLLRVFDGLTRQRDQKAQRVKRGGTLPLPPINEMTSGIEGAALIEEKSPDLAYHHPCPAFFGGGTVEGASEPSAFYRRALPPVCSHRVVFQSRRPRMKPDIQIIPKLWTTIPEAIRSRVGREPGPQRAMLEEGHLLIILHQIPGPDDATRRPALFWRQPDGSWKSQPDAGGLLALQNHLAAFAARLDELDKAEHAAQTATEYHKVLEAIAPVLRSSRGLHRALQQAREFVKADRDLINLRDSAASIERNAELLLQDAQFGLNFTVAKQAEAQAQSAQRMANTSHRLNVLAALFLPLTALTGLFSMYVRADIADTPANFWLIASTGVIVGLAISSIVVARQ